MCGIIGYTGRQSVVPLLLAALRRLEYRGYDSAGIAVATASGSLEIRKAVGKIENLAAVLAHDAPQGQVGIGHTRWATHGRPSDENAHPHTDCSGRLCVVHNGVVENYRELRAELEAAGHHLVSQTDTEVLAHLIELELCEAGERGRDHDVAASGLPSNEPAPDEPGLCLLRACKRALDRVEGLYAIAVISVDEPGVIVGARRRAPLVVGRAEHGNFLASDVPALLEQTRNIIRLEEGDLVAVRADSVLVMDHLGHRVERPLERIDQDFFSAERGGYAHFFLKEVNEQPEAIQRTLTGRVVLDRIHLAELEHMDVDRVRRILLTGCGSAYHACMMARYAYETWLRLPVEVEIASELRYRNPIIDDTVLCIAVSQSGETADTIAAFELAGAMGAQRMAVTNVVGSAISSLADFVLYQQSGPEVAVVASKSFTGQVVSLLLTGLWLGQRSGRGDAGTLAEGARALCQLPSQVRGALASEAAASRIAEQHAGVESLLFLGRGAGYPTALEGALKLKEISYIHAEGYPAGELKHGPLALIQPGSIVVVLATQSATLDKLLSNVEEVRARGGHIIAIVSEGDTRAALHADEVIQVPCAPELMAPVVNSIPLQLLAYHAAVARGVDVDKPRNLAKSVTVE